jgi:hypothetical protein
MRNKKVSKTFKKKYRNNFWGYYTNYKIKQVAGISFEDYCKTISFAIKQK